MPDLNPAPRLTGVQWLICILASIGFAFDIYELLMLPLVAPPALLELTGAVRGTPEFAGYISWLFFLPAVMGAIFGLLGGYLTDRLGRRRVLTWSIMIYAVSAFLAGFSTSFEMLLTLRCFTFVGVCVEFVAAVAWLSELFDDPRQREKVLGYTQAFSSVGGLLVAVANGLAVTYALDLPGVQIPEFLSGMLGSIDAEHTNEAWRYTLMSGLIPAIPLIVIRPFLPESPKWKEKKDAGTLRRPSIAELFAPKLRKTVIVTTILFACSYGMAFGAIQHMPRIIPGLPSIVEATAEMTRPEAGSLIQGTASNVSKVQEVGGLVGRVLLAILILRIASRRRLLRTFLLPGMFVIPLTFFLAAQHSLFWLYPAMFFTGLVVVGQFSFWGNYLPHAYPLHLRGTGESFAANIGGRLIGTAFFAVTANLAATEYVPGETAPERLAWTSGFVGLFLVIVALLVSPQLPEPSSEELPE